MIEVKYGCDWGGWWSSSFSGPYGVNLWKNIRRGGTFYLGLLCLKLEMDQKCSFGLIVGVGLLRSQSAILNYIGLAVAKRQVWRI